MTRYTDLPVVRRATIEDLTSICSLAEQLGYPSSTEEMRDRMTAISSASDQAIYVIDLPGQPAAGYIHVFKHTSLESGTVAEIGGLVVDKQLRRLGLGKSLLSAAETWAREMDCSIIRLRSNIIREDAHRFYQKSGYAITKTQYTFSKPLKEK